MQDKVLSDRRYRYAVLQHSADQSFGCYDLNFLMCLTKKDMNMRKLLTLNYRYFSGHNIESSIVSSALNSASNLT